MTEPRNRLKKLRLEEISVVDLGADPNATIQIFKRQSGEHKMDPDFASQMEAATAKIVELTKSLDDESKARKAAEEKVTALTAELGVAKAAQTSDDPDAILKGADPVLAAEIIKLRKANADAAAALARLDDEREIAKMATTIAADLPNLAVDPGKFAPIMKRASGAMPAEDFSELTRVLKAASAAAGMMISAVGIPAHLAATGDAEARLNELAKVRADSKGVSFAKAYSEVLADPANKPLYRQYLRESGQQVN